MVYSVFQSAEVQKLWVLGKRQEAKVKREEKYVYLTSLGNAIISQYEMMGSSVLFGVFSCLLILKTLAKSTLTYLRTVTTGD
ncbi:hypothetical protein [Microcystis aeruginosa]|uniref:Programmed cell death toxin YdcE n=1 Tax=Microcystis aeruginosa NIES-44 TaxID=449439 RepID=A0A0A1VTG4_MICAE|nr:hypothetical protein [Microcystis aeruginosa]GAL92990.1 programmed cell death toxin YdcE [Microcystis aeruginosa NIES-44]